MLPRLILALRFLTRLPMPGPCADFAELGKSAAYFPLAGLVIGVLVSLAALGAASLWHSALVGGLAAVVANALVTGGLHLDGLMDSCDGLFGAHTRERALEIMRDPRVGSFGVLGGLVAVLARCLFTAGHGWPAWPGILLAPVIARFVQVWAVASFPYARPQGTGKAFDGATGRGQVAAAGISALLLGLAIGGVPAAAWLSAGWLAGAAVAWRIHRRLGGLTGDSYGAITEVSEWAVLATAWLLPAAGWPGPGL